MEQNEPVGIGDLSNLPPFFARLLITLPPAFGRSEIPRLIPGVVSRGYLQNLDSEGRGPERMVVGRKTMYIRESFVIWLWRRSTSIGKAER